MEELPVTERMNREGNALFLARKFQEAITAYPEAVFNVRYDKTGGLLKSQIMRNIGGCHYELSLESFSQASTREDPFLKMAEVMEKRLQTAES